MAYIGRPSIVGNFVKLDAISVVNGQAGYTMNNGGSAFTDYENVNQFLVSLNGILQAPTDSFTASKIISFSIPLSFETDSITLASSSFILFLYKSKLAFKISSKHMSNIFPLSLILILLPITPSITPTKTFLELSS